MKPTITPEAYKKKLDVLDLKDIALTYASFKLKKEQLSESLSVDIDETHSFRQKEDRLFVQYKYDFHAFGHNTKEPAIVLKAHYTVEYSVGGGVIIKKDFMEIFTDLTVSIILWPYFREFVNNAIQRMGLPSLVLGLKKRN